MDGPRWWWRCFQGKWITFTRIYGKWNKVKIEYFNDCFEMPKTNGTLNLDLVSSVLPCAGLSTLNRTNRGQNAEQNMHMLKAAQYVLICNLSFILVKMLLVSSPQKICWNNNGRLRDLHLHDLPAVAIFGLPKITFTFGVGWLRYLSWRRCGSRAAWWAGRAGPGGPGWPVQPSSARSALSACSAMNNNVIIFNSFH